MVKLKSRALRYGVALALLAAAALLRAMLDPWLGSRAPYGPFYAMVALVVWLAGAAPATLAAVASYLIGTYLYVDPRATIDLSATNLLSLSTYLVSCGVIIAFGAMARRRHLQSKAYAEELQEKNAQLRREVEERRAAELATQEAQARVGSILSSISECHSMLDRQWRITEFSPQTERFFGISKESVLGRNVWEVFPRACGTALESNYRRAMEEGVPVEFELISPTNGKWMEVRAYPSRHGLSIFFRDISERKDAEMALRASEERLRLAAQAAKFGTYDYVLSTGELYWSPEARMITGLTPDEPVTLQRLAERIHPEDREHVVTARTASFDPRGSGEFHFEHRFLHSDGSIRWALGRGRTLFEGEGEHRRPVRSTGVLLDITELKRTEAALRDSERQLRLVTDNMPALVSYIDRDGYYRFANAAYEEWLGVSSAELIGRNVDELIPESIRETRRPHVEATLEGEIVRFEGPMVHRTLGERVCDIAFVPDLDRHGRINGHYVMALDITERKRAEEALKEAGRRKDEFLATLAHELRNPLAPIRNAVQFLKLKGPPEPALQNARNIVERQTKHLARLVDDLLEVSRITRGKIDLRRERVSLETLVTNALESAQPLVDAARHTLDVILPPEPVLLDVDPTRVSQVLLNVLNNAAKYTPPGGHIVLSARVESENVLICIRDNGIGIDPGQLERIFELFSQANDAHLHGGLGIGLALARQLARLHGGELMARSEGRGCGSEFIVRLPARVQSPVMRAMKPADFVATTGPGRRVLVVDDNVDAADTLAMLLETSGHSVKTAYEGTSALEVFEDFRPDVVLLDIGMPQLDGCEVARRIRAMAAGRNALLIALTGWGQAEDRRRTLEAGFDEHLTKPADPAMLASLIAPRAAPGTRAMA